MNNVATEVRWRSSSLRTSSLKDACKKFVGQVGSTATFSGRCLTGMFRRPYETGELLRHLDELGAQSLAVVGATGLIVGLILAIQSRPALARFGAESYVPAMVSISVVRELGPILTALMVAGRVGSGISAELEKKLDSQKTLEAKVSSQVQALEERTAKAPK